MLRMMILRIQCAEKRPQISRFCTAAFVLCWLASPNIGFCQRIPQLVKIQDERIRTSWAEVEKIIAENEGAKRPSHEPYLARAELWAIAGCHEEALQDYLRGTDLFFRDNPTPSERTAHLEQLKTALEALVRRPKPSFPDLALRQFGQGLALYQRRQVAEATWFFDEACRLKTDVPIYRIYRALCYKQQGRPIEADREASIARNLIRERPADSEQELQGIHQRLEFVQGPLRQWLEQELAKPNSEPASSPLKLSQKP